MKRILCILILVMMGCKQAYNPPVKNISTGYLVVEGNIVAGNDSTYFNLSRTTAINDTSGINRPETNASVKIESNDGDTYQLKDEANGIYDAPPLNINTGKQYRVHIFTADGTEYASDFVAVKITPPIDSITWTFDTTKGVDIYVSSHDAENKTLYYRWDFTETWQHSPVYHSGLIYDPNSVSGVRFRNPDEQITNCWNIVPSSSINIFSSTQLSSDVAYKKHLANIPYNDEKLSIVYSILVKQFALTKEAFEFWDNLRKNTEQLGSIFDPQPFADFGNIHCITNTSVPVIGFISAGSVQEQRIYIRNSDLPSWNYVLELCPLDTIPPKKVSFIADNSHIPLYYISIPGTPVPGVLITVPECADCRLHGGTTVKPPYMP